MSNLNLPMPSRQTFLPNLQRFGMQSAILLFKRLWNSNLSQLGLSGFVRFYGMKWKIMWPMLAVNGSER